MKKLIFAFLLALAAALPAAAAETVTASLPDYPVYISGSGPSATSVEYPVLEAGGTLYVPMTYANIRVFGLSSAWHNGEFHLAYSASLADGNHIISDYQTDRINKVDIYHDIYSEMTVDKYSRMISQSTYPKDYWENVPSENSNLEYTGTYELTVAENPIYINGRLYDNLNEENPVLLYRDIYYIPMDDYFLFELRKYFLHDDEYQYGALYIITLADEYLKGGGEYLGFLLDNDGYLRYFETVQYTGMKSQVYRYKYLDSETNTIGDVGTVHYSWEDGILIREGLEYLRELDAKCGGTEDSFGRYDHLNHTEITEDGTIYSYNYDSRIGLRITYPDGTVEQFEDGDHDTFQLYGMIDGRPLVLALHDEISLLEDGFYTIEADGTLKYYAYYSFYPAFTVNNKLYFIDPRIHSFIDASTGERISYRGNE